MLFITLCLLFSCDPQTAKEYTVVFDANSGTFGGEETVTRTVLEGSRVEKPEEPTRIDYIFQGWYTEAQEGREYDFSTPVTSSFTLYARWIPSDGYVITYSQGVATYHVYTEAGLRVWAENALSSRYHDTGCVLENDITLAEPASGQGNWTPVGNITTSYAGIFDGNGHTISNVIINSSASMVGFFGHVYDGTIKNLTLKDVEVSASGFTGSSLYTGGLIGYTTTSTIENCHVEGTVEASAPQNASSAAGGIVGRASGCTILACSSSANVSSGTSGSTSRAGGICGEMYTAASIIGCYATGTIDGKEECGITSGSTTENYKTDIIGCYSTADATYGIVQNMTQRMEVTDCYYTKAETASPSGGSTKVVGDVTWENAMDAMNRALETANANYRYEINSGSDSSSMPLVIKSL